MKKLALLVCLIFSVALLTQVGDSPLLAQPSPTVNVDLLIGPDQVVQDGTFIVLVSLDPTHLIEVDAFQVYLDFDPAVLQLVPASPTNDVQPGAPFGANRFQDVLQNSVNNTTGTVDFAGGRGINGLPTLAPFLAAAMKFQAIAPATTTSITLSIVAPRQTKVVSGINDVTGTLNGVSFAVGGNTPLADLFKSLP